MNFVIGKSDWRKDWNYAQPPRDGKPTTWTVTFDLAERRKAKRRCGWRSAAVAAAAALKWPSMTSRSAARGRSLDSGVMHRDGIRGYWQEKDVLLMRRC